jgi:hypothetical protein
MCLNILDLVIVIALRVDDQGNDERFKDFKSGHFDFFNV